MRRLVFLAASGLMLTGCHYASSPLDGFGGFVSDTQLLRNNPNLPNASSENVQRAQGQMVATDPLTPEPGNIWPGPPQAEPTLEDAIKAEQTDPSAPGISGVAPSMPYGSAAHPQPRPSVTTTPPASISVPPPTIDTPNGAQPLSHNGMTTTTQPGVGGASIVVPNGNGTSTVIGPDGSTQTVPTTR